MAAQLYGQVSSELGSQFADAIVQGVFGRKSYDSGVDHQSELTCPLTAGSKEWTRNSFQLNLEFFKELSEALASDKDAHIRGGNDNEEYADGYEGKDNERWAWLRHITERSRNTLIARKQNGVWSIFNKGDGTKLHLNFDKKKICQDKYRPETPELVDIKITDYCPFNCRWCYQDSKPTGVHADLESIKTLAWSLGHAEVFEVALGGGEPTMHPDFVEILREFYRHGIVPNFTTKSLHWLKDKETVEAVSKYVGAIAYSVVHPMDIQKFLAVYKGAQEIFGVQLPRLTFQYILDAEASYMFDEVLKQVPKGYYANTLTLLGYKSCGRGGKRPHTNSGWLKKIQAMDQYSRPNVAIDTLLASQYKDELGDISEKLYYVEEGRFSLYIDAVKKVFAKSSFVPENEYKKYSHYSEIEKEFQKWT